MKIGVTGTRSGMNEIQKENLTFYLSRVINTYGVVSFHHGDCIGVDVESAAIAKKLGFYIISHPPTKNDLRGHFCSDEQRIPQTYFKRNREIVDETDVLFVVPFQNEHQNNGGTWYTYDYAVKQFCTTITFFPDGRVETRTNK